MQNQKKQGDSFLLYEVINRSERKVKNRRFGLFYNNGFQSVDEGAAKDVKRTVGSAHFIDRGKTYKVLPLSPLESITAAV